MQDFFDSLRTELLHDKSKVKVTMPQLPGMNTPQFDWMRNKMPNRPRPMGTIYQPEVSARAIYYSAYHDVREFDVTKSSLMVVLGNKLFPEIGDKYLAKKGYKGQQTSEKAEDRPDNLFEPVEGDYGAHGRFDKKAKSKSKAAWLGRQGDPHCSRSVCRYNSRRAPFEALTKTNIKRKERTDNLLPLNQS